MGLSIFSFDLAALINSLSQAADAIESVIDAPPLVFPTEPAPLPTSAAAVIKAEETTTEAIIEDILLAASVSQAALSIISPDEALKKAPPAAESTPVPAVPTPVAAPKPAAPKPLDEEYKKALEALIRSLQTSVVHAYQSADMINESVALKTLSDATRRSAPTAFETVSDRTGDEKKRREQKLDALRDELKKAMLKEQARQRS